MLSLSQGHFHPFGNDDEHVRDTQYDHRLIEENIKVVGSTKTHAYSTGNIHNEIVDLNFVECGQALGKNNDELALPS